MDFMTTYTEDQLRTVVLTHWPWIEPMLDSGEIGISKALNLTVLPLFLNKVAIPDEDRELITQALEDLYTDGWLTNLVREK